MEEQQQQQQQQQQTKTVEVVKLLKECLTNVTTSSLNARKEIFKQKLVQSTQHEAFQESQLKGISKIIMLTLSRYRDTYSRHMVLDFITKLLKKHGLIMAKYLLSEMHPVANNLSQYSGSLYRASVGLTLLQWCSKINCVYLPKKSEDASILKPLVEVEILCYSTICSAADAAGAERIKQSARICLSQHKKLEDVLGYVDIILKNEKIPIQSLYMLDFVFSYLKDHKAAGSITTEMKKSLVDMFLKNCVQTKVKAPTTCLAHVGAFLKHLTHDEFAAVLPLLQKSLLRNPETILQAVSYLLAGLSIDLSRYIESLSVSICSHLVSQNASLRADAIVAVENIAKQCSDASAVEVLIKHILKILAGSEGKLGLPEQRITVLLGIVSVSKATLSSSHMESLSNIVFKQLFPFILQEGHEGALLQALNTMKIWCKYFTTDLPADFCDSIKKGIGAKNCSALVRANYYQVAAEAIKGNTLLKGLPLLDTLLQTVEKAKTQTHMLNNVYEAVVASSIIARMAMLDDIPENKFESFWTTILDPAKKMLIGEKFLATEQSEHFQQLASLMNVLFLNHSQRLIKKGIQPWYQAFQVLLLHSDHATTTLAKTVLTKLIGSGDVNWLDFQQAMFTHLHQFVVNYETRCAEVQEGKVVPLKKVVQTYHFVATCGADVENLEQSHATLLGCFTHLHHPTLLKHNPKILTNMAHVLNIDLKVFVEQNKQQLVDIFLQRNDLDEMHCNGLASLLVYQPEELLADLMKHLLESLSDASLNHVTSDEIGILNTPEGEAYNQKVYENAKSVDQKQANMKRESKAYSYKEQKIEMELRAELDQKKGKVAKQPELSQKQKEQLQIILAEEKEIRNKLRVLEKALIRDMMILNVCLDVDSSHLKEYHVDLMGNLLRLSTSLLAAPHVVKLYLKLATCIFKGDLNSVGLFLGNVNLRCAKSPHTLPSGWAEEDYKEQVKRALSIVHTFVTERNVNLMMTYTRKKPFSAPGFAYFLPLLRTVLKDRGVVVAHSETLRLNALQVIMVHSKLRSNSVEMLDENGPELLPLSEMLQILSGVIVDCDGNNKDNKVQKYANTVFDEVCKAASGDIGCTIATNTEIHHLLANISSTCTVLRNASLKGLLEIIDILPTQEDDMWNTLTRKVLIARYDESEENAQLAQSLWEQASMNVTPAMTRELVESVTHPLPDIRLAACKGLATALGATPDVAPETLTKLLVIYQEKMKIPPPVIDNLGRTVSTNWVDPWESRQGIGMALQKCVEFVSGDMLETLFHFFVPGALGDRDERVRKQMLDAAVECVNMYGEANMTVLLNIFDEFLDKAPDSSAQDTIRQSVIILTGSLAKHLEKTDPKIKPVFAKLMAALATPSQSVQQAVAECLPPLCAAMKAEAPELIKGLLAQLLESESYGERRGAAYGLAGVVKGLGILTLKQQNVISTLNESIQDKKNWKYREGALFAFETLCTMLGRLFEPYVVHLLPHLLLCFGDGNQYVREAADETAKAVMRNLSNHGVKLVLPSLLKALEEESWRTKTGSAELLGAMSFCAPKQLSSCLPSIVPKLTEVLADSHIKVQKAGQQALRQIGGVIRNPEIQEISPIILDALADPNKNIVACLEGLLSTSFVHFIDAPSLALIMPTLEKALDKRATKTKKMAAQILGNMYALTDPKDLSPYLPAVVPGLKKSLLDPSPEVRAVSARALGATVKGMGKECFDELMPWLLETLTSEVSSVDRSGAAQGLSEVLHALGQERLDNLMPEVIATTEKTDLAPNVRDGYLMLYIYLPATFGDDFMEYIGPIVPSILKGLADESEYVRDTSLKAGQRIISMYSDSAIELLLPQLEAGLFDTHWRIRYSSVQLLGDLLFRLSGVTGKQSTVGDEDDNFGTAHSAQIILETLGPERRDRVYAGLYMGRSDVALTVRQAALHVWKVIVQNTAKTLREILPVLFELLLGCLASQSYDKRQVAARSLGDLVRKLGERILPEIIPILEAGADHEDGDKRQGVCIGLSEIMDSTSRDMIAQFEDSLIATVRKALVDELGSVREAAAATFENLHNTIGHRALDGVLPNVFQQLDDPSLAEYALDGLKQVMAVKSKSVLPFLIPKLTTPPVNTKALAILSSVAGEALIKHLEKILPAMIQAVNAETDGSDVAFEGTKTLILSVDDETGIHVIIDELISASKNQNPGIRKVAANLLAMFCKESKAEFGQYVQQLFRCFIQLMNDVDEDVYTGGWTALDALVKHLDPSEQLQHLSSLRQAIKFIKDDVRGEQLPGFCILKKGITPILPIFREGMLNGPQEVKEQTAAVLGEIIRLTSAAAIRPSVVHITGPLIRILGDRFNWTVKVAILDTLGLLLEKVGIVLKPFLPQLQTTFVKALNDPTLAVRTKAAWTLGLLTVLHTRVDSLFTELRNGVKDTEDNAIRETILQALRTIILKAGAKMSDAVRQSLLETLQELLDHPEDGVRVHAGSALGAMCQILSDEELKTLLTDSLLDDNPTSEWISSHGRAVALSYALFDAPSKLFEAVSEDDVINAAVQHSDNDRVPVCTYGVHSLGHLLMFSKQKPQAASPNVLSSIKKNLQHSSNDVKLAALETMKHVSKNSPEVLRYEIVSEMIPELKLLVRDRNTGVRAFAELTFAFVLQIHKNDLLFDECITNLPDSVNFLQEYRNVTFEKISETVASDTDEYKFLT